MIKIDLSFLKYCSYAFIPAICICEHFWFASSILRIIYGILLELVETFDGAFRHFAIKVLIDPMLETKKGHLYTPVFLFEENVIQAVKQSVSFCYLDWHLCCCCWCKVWGAHHQPIQFLDVWIIHLWSLDWCIRILLSCFKRQN